uniref:Uncharacterized protein n=1 Tax=Tanacetum cinerariifolium TaxID=118510 RepID=A0A6L2LND2_TANCI|nr:hypothetical protein [Tanacetum cinerariifolium]
MLLMAFLNEHLLTFSQYKDAKTLFEAIQARFGGNDATKKTQKTLLKQMYENFNAPSTESLDSIFNRLQKIVSQLPFWVKTSLKKISIPNEVDTATIQVNIVGTPVSTVSSHDNTANLSDATVFKVTVSFAEHESKKALPENWECRSHRNQESRLRNQDSSRKTMNVKDTSSKAMVAIDGAGLFAPPTIDLSNFGLEEFQHPEFKGYGPKDRYGPKDSKSVCVDTSNEIKKAPDAPIIEDYVSDSDEDEYEEMVLKIDNVQHKPEQANQSRKVSQNPRNNRTNWNEMITQKLEVRLQFTKKAYFVCGSFSQ